MGVQSYMDDVIQTARTNFNAQRSTLDEKIARIRKANKNTDVCCRYLLYIYLMDFLI